MVFSLFSFLNTQNGVLIVCLNWEKEPRKDTKQEEEFTLFRAASYHLVVSKPEQHYSLETQGSYFFCRKIQINSLQTIYRQWKKNLIV